MDNLTGGGQGGIDDIDKPIPLDDPGPGGAGVSRAPLNLGGQGRQPRAPAAAPKPAAQNRPVTADKPAPKPAANATGGARITGVKTFFTKLHPGAIEFLDGQIAEWLKKNPGVTVKSTNTTVGEVQAKKTEPNIIVSVWY